LTTAAAALLIGISEGLLFAQQPTPQAPAAGRAPVEVLVIDSVERPSDN